MRCRIRSALQEPWLIVHILHICHLFFNILFAKVLFTVVAFSFYVYNSPPVSKNLCLFINGYLNLDASVSLGTSGIHLFPEDLVTDVIHKYSLYDYRVIYGLHFPLYVIEMI